jgi:tRNA threonylcarbamoyl adenosine modification protein (Sua5/YciO/YrdC/YwlC family)
MLLKIHPENPGTRNIDRVVECLNRDGVIICPTDTVYCFACDIYSTKAVERICRIKGINPEKAMNLSIAFFDFSHVSDFTAQIDTPTFRVLKSNLPGPFTFILPANKKVPKILKIKKKTVGIRIPDNNIVREIIRKLDRPIMTTSVHDADDVIDYTTNPELINEKYEKQVDITIDGGFGRNIPSTIVDCTDDEFRIVRQGLGKLKI